MHRPSLRAWASTAVAALCASLFVAAAPALAAEPEAQPEPPINSDQLTTWTHTNGVASTQPIGADEVRKSPFYQASVATNAEPTKAYESFVYMTLPHGGGGKRGYTEQDGAEFATEAGLTMSWSSFEYATDVWVNVSLETGQHVQSVDEVQIRPSNLNFEKQLVDDHTVRVKVPYSEEGYRFSVEFAPQQLTAYNDMSGASGLLTTEATGNREIHTEPQNSMLIFANPKLSATERERTVPTEADGKIYAPEPGLVNNLNTTDADILYFGPGTYYMGEDYHALLPEQVKWVYIAPGAIVKGAFRFVHETQSHFKVTGRGVLSGEQYVYEANTKEGYQHNTAENCHSDCVKMLQFESSNKGQTLDLEGVTIAEPPYHSFVVYAKDDKGEIGVENFHMDVNNYKQVGGWYWQTDGIELYPNGRMKNTFFHANDDVLKLYHSDVQMTDTVIWKGENGPVMQWGWGPRNIDGVQVTNTDIIHNRMGWKDVKYNTCVFNSSTHWEDMGATDRADTAQTVKNMTFTNTRVEGAVNCGIRLFAMANTENITIDGFEVDRWNSLDTSSQVSMLKRFFDKSGKQVSIGNEMRDGNGLLLHNYTVGGVPIVKSGDNWSSHERGRLDFDAENWDMWNATADGEATGTAPTLTVDLPADGSIAPARDIALKGTTDAASVSVKVNEKEVSSSLVNGTIRADIALPAITNRIVVTATGANGVQNVERRTLTALGTLVGSVSDPEGDDNGPGSYTYPTDGAYNKGSFDLTGLAVYEDGEDVRFVVTAAGRIQNPWGGNGMSTQRVSIALSDPASKTPMELLPGSNMSTKTGWSRTIVADGRYEGSTYGPGVYDADHHRTGKVSLDVNPTGTIVASVAAKDLGETDLSKVGYQVSMFSSAEETEGAGNIRPIYSADCAAGIGCPDFAGPHRGAGGLGVFTDQNAAKDTDSTDSNAFDIISGDAKQSELMDFTRGPIVVPFVQLVAADEGTTEPTPGPSTQPTNAPSAPHDPSAPADATDTNAVAVTGTAMPVVALLAALALLSLGLALALRRRALREGSSS